MSLLSRLLGLLACMIFAPGAYSIEIGFYAEEGDEAIGIFNNYEATEGISVEEDVEAKFCSLEMTDSRKTAGGGDFNLRQDFLGSSTTGNFAADRTLQGDSVQGLSDSSNVDLKPASFDARTSTVASAAGGFTSTEFFGFTGRCFSGFSSYIKGGFFKNTDGMSIDVDDGVALARTSAYRTTGQSGYLADYGIASGKAPHHGYSINAYWADPGSIYAIGINSVAKARKTSSNLKLRITIEKE